MLWAALVVLHVDHMTVWCLCVCPPDQKVSQELNLFDSCPVYSEAFWAGLCPPFALCHPKPLQVMQVRGPGRFNVTTAAEVVVGVPGNYRDCLTHSCIILIASPVLFPFLERFWSDHMLIFSLAIRKTSWPRFMLSEQILS